MTTSITKALSCLKIANFIAILGSGITWTGLSYDLSLKYNDPRFMAFMQVLSVATSFIGPFLGLWLNSHTRIRSIIVTAEGIAAVCCAAIFLLLTYSTAFDFYSIASIVVLVFMILLTSAVSSLFIEPMYANLVEKRDGSDKNVRSEFATFSYIAILSKLCGMSAGPFLFLFMGQYSLIVNVASFFFSMLCLWIAMNNVPDDVAIVSIRPEEVTIFRKSTWAQIVRFPLLETAIANSLIFVVVLAMSTQAMTLQASPTELSLFWFGATACAFLSHFFLSRNTYRAEALFRTERKYGFLQTIPIFTGLMMNSVPILLVSQWLFSLLNPLATNQSRADFYRAYGRDSTKALDAYAMRTILTNLIVLSFSLFVSLIGTQTTILFLAGSLAILVVVRWWIAKRILSSDSREKIGSL